jgi:hypothetical protein
MVDFITYCFVSYALAITLNKISFSKNPCSFFLKWFLTLVIFSLGSIALYLSKVIAYQKISEELGIDMNAHNSSGVIFSGAFIIAAIFNNALGGNHNLDLKTKSCPLCKSSLASNASQCIFCGENLSSFIQTTFENYLHSGMYDSQRYSGLNCIFFPNGECAIEILDNNFRLCETKKDLFKSIDSFINNGTFLNNGFLRSIEVKF